MIFFFLVLPLKVKVKKGSVNSGWSLVKPPRFTMLDSLIPEEVFFSPVSEIDRKRVRPLYLDSFRAPSADFRLYL